MPGAETRRVVDIVRSFDDRDLIIPDYQRAYCWDLKKATHFLQRTKEIGHVLGVITTYRLEGKQTEYLQDGYQRITTLSNAIGKKLKDNLSNEDLQLIKQAQVSHQSMVYKTHDEARQDFQHLNDGVGLTSYEKYRGDLECDNEGRELYATVRDATFELSRRISGESVTIKQQRKLSGQRHRQSLGLFYQYATKHTEKQIYAKSEKNLQSQIERRTREWLNNNMTSWKATVDSYARSLERVNAMMIEAVRDQTLKKWDVAAVRSFYATYFYCQNIGCPMDRFASLIEWYVGQHDFRCNWASRWDIDYEGEKRRFRMDQTNLKWLENAAKLGAPEISRPKREKKIDAPAGYHESHVIPHADGGIEVFTEPSILNQSRGRREVS